MRLEDEFDAVLMLTWSNWQTEPRSNRYHYATRFAQHVPVLFFQPWAPIGTKLRVEQTEVVNIDVVHATHGYSISEIDQVRALLRARSIKRPLLWIYDSLHYAGLIDNLDDCFKVYHATEDYFTTSDGFSIDNLPSIRKSIKSLLPRVDLLIPVSAGVLHSYLANVAYENDYLVLENGCDAEFFLAHAHKEAPATQGLKSKDVAIFQGGINKRVDFNLLLGVVQALPQWEFRFCGASTETAGWRRLAKEKNVVYLGVLSPEQIAQEMTQASVGIIPFIQDQCMRNSLPLKAYEYVACGLPVVTIPIDALATSPQLFLFAETAEAFAAQIEVAGATRNDPELLALRTTAARRNSYDARFLELQTALVKKHQKLKGLKKRLNVAILFDQASAVVGTVREHLNAFHLFSSNDVTYVPCTGSKPILDANRNVFAIDLSIFDVVIVHYSVRLSLKDHLNRSFAAALERFGGCKVLFIQDEYDTTEIARSWMDRINFDIVYTCVPLAGLEKIYPGYRFPTTDFISNLTGYVPDSSAMERFARPLRDRTVLIGYRGRRLPPIYGQLGQEKYQIGVTVKAEAQKLGIPVDIEVDDAKRIYGEGWYAFLGVARATLGTESGSNVFDFDGSLQKQVTAFEKKNPGAGFDKTIESVLSAHEGLIQMNQVSPKIFEAIRLRTALILFEGDYSGVVQSNVHYIPLKKDFSNLEEVFQKLTDDAYIESLTQRAYTDIVSSGKYSYRRFIESVDQDLAARVLHAKRRKTLVGAIHSLEADGSLKPLFPALPLNLAAGVSPLDCKEPMTALASQITTPRAFGGGCAGPGSVAVRGLRWLWSCFPLGFREQVAPIIEVGLGRPITGKQSDAYAFRAARGLWNLLPYSVQSRIVRMVRPD